MVRSRKDEVILFFPEDFWDSQTNLSFEIWTLGRWDLLL